MKALKPQLAMALMLLFPLATTALMPPQEQLHAAVLSNNINKTEQLIAQGENVNKIDPRYGCTALHLAVRNGNLEMVKALRKAGAKIYTANEQKEPLIIAGVMSGNAKLVKYLLENGASLKSRTADGSTCLHTAINYRLKDMALFLIEQGVDVNTINKKGLSPLHINARTNQIDIVNELIKAGAEIEAVTWHKETPLHIALEHKNVAVANKLIDAKANLTALTDSKSAPLEMAVMTGNIKLVEKILKFGIKPDKAKNERFSPLFRAVYNRKDTAMTDLLIHYGVDVNEPLGHGRTAIFYAVWNDDVHMFKLLHENNADLNIKNDDGKTPLEEADRLNAPKIQKYIKTCNLK